MNRWDRWELKNEDRIFREKSRWHYLNIEQQRIKAYGRPHYDYMDAYERMTQPEPITTLPLRETERVLSELKVQGMDKEFKRLHKQWNSQQRVK